MRCCAIAVVMLAELLSSSSAYAAFTTTPLPRMVTGATAVVKVKVLKIEQPDPKRTDRQFITLEVEKLLAGKCDQRIEYVYGGNTAYGNSPGYTVGEECYLCLEPDDEEQGKYREVNFGHSKIAIRDGKVVLWERVVPEYLKKRVENLTTQGFEDLALWLRGPTITLKPVKESFSCDEPIEFALTVKNQTADPMVLVAGHGLAFGAQCDLMLWDAHGFACSDNWVYGGRKSYGDEETFPDDQKDFRRRLEPGKTFTASARFHVRLDDFQQDPAEVRVAVLRYWSRAGEEAHKEAEYWGESLQTSCSVRITCPYPRWAADLRRPSKALAVCLYLSNYSNAQVVVPKQGIRLEVGFIRPMNPELTKELSGGVDLLTPADVKKALASCLRIEHDGKVLAGPKPDSERVLAWLAAQRPITHGKGAELDLAEYLGVDAPGVYRIRFVLPDKDGDALSNVVQLTVPEKNAP
ncbi:MAG: hypothetical protein NTW87_03265 [Planctomycetota bacterium]|nr:hypothetical protein [Planctomycetota bacterium]